MGFFSSSHLAASLLLLCLGIALLLRPTNARNCDFFTGRWVKDLSYPLYSVSTCPFIEKEFTCQKNGRPDLDYTKYKWQPLGCNLTRFNGLKFLERFRGKKIMFVGDSLSRNQWQSLTCMLHSDAPNSIYNLSREGDISTFAFPEYEVEVKLDRNVYLVDVVRQNIGRVLELDSIELSAKRWTGIDMFIFNTWHWWNRRGPTQPWDFIKTGDKIEKDIDRLVAFEKALKTWGNWIDTNIDPAKTAVYFQGISPSHYNGTLWGEPGAKNCIGQTQPLSGSTYPGGLPAAVNVLKSALGKIKQPVTLLDITTLSLLRKDGHPSNYGLPGIDCSHWCLAGVPDTWNEILYNLIIDNST